MSDYPFILSLAPHRIAALELEDQPDDNDNTYYWVSDGQRHTQWAVRNDVLADPEAVQWVADNVVKHFGRYRKQKDG
jgi:hypothetical protein